MVAKVGLAGVVWYTGEISEVAVESAGDKFLPMKGQKVDKD